MLEKTYDAKTVEPKIAKIWEEADAFRAGLGSRARPKRIRFFPDFGDLRLDGFCVVGLFKHGKKVRNVGNLSLRCKPEGYGQVNSAAT